MIGESVYCVLFRCRSCKTATKIQLYLIPPCPRLDQMPALYHLRYNFSDPCCNRHRSDVPRIPQWSFRIVSLHMVPEHEFLWMRIQIDLIAYVANIKNLDIVPDER